MVTAKQIVRFPSRLSKRLSLARRIRELDAKADQHRLGGLGLMNNGWCKTTIDDLLESPGITLRMKSSALRQEPEAGRQIYWSWSIPEFVWEAVLSSKKLQKLAQDYLGLGVRLDDLYLKTVKDGLQSGAEGWHDDNVGYRLKVFMVFDVEGKPSDTLIIPRERPNPYRVKIKEEVTRMLGAPDKAHRGEEVRLAYVAGDCLVFDTNLLHRGDYTSSDGVRYCLVAEFIDREKADELRKYCPCGPGQSEFRITIPIADASLLQNNALPDKKLLSCRDEKYSYGY
jgi:hypothetical protein